MYWARIGAAAAQSRSCGRSASFTPGSRTSSMRKPGMLYARVDGWFGFDMIGSPRERAGGGVLSPRPRPSGLGRSRGAVAVLLEDPGLHALDRLAVAVDGAEVVEVAPLRAGAERARREGHVDLAVGALPEAEADEPRAGQRALLEVDLRFGHETLRTVLTRHEMDLHRFLLGTSCPACAS